MSLGRYGAQNSPKKRSIRRFAGLEWMYLTGVEKFAVVRPRHSAAQAGLIAESGAAVRDRALCLDAATSQLLVVPSGDLHMDTDNDQGVALTRFAVAADILQGGWEEIQTHQRLHAASDVREIPCLPRQN
jgi:hypothetical protein